MGRHCRGGSVILDEIRMELCVKRSETNRSKFSIRQGVRNKATAQYPNLTNE